MEPKTTQQINTGKEDTQVQMDQRIHNHTLQQQWEIQAIAKLVNNTIVNRKAHTIIHLHQTQISIRNQ